MIHYLSVWFHMEWPSTRKLNLHQFLHLHLFLVICWKLSTLKIKLIPTGFSCRGKINSKDLRLMFWNSTTRPLLEQPNKFYTIEQKGIVFDHLMDFYMIGWKFWMCIEWSSIKALFFDLDFANSFSFSSPLFFRREEQRGKW